MAQAVSRRLPTTVARVRAQVKSCGICCGQSSAEVGFLQGRAITQAVSRRLPTTGARVRAQVKSCGICSGQSGAGAGFLRVLPLLLQIFIPPTAPYSSSIIRGWYNSPVRGRRTKWTQSHPTPCRFSPSTTETRVNHCHLVTQTTASSLESYNMLFLI
jgi:hypothetical protein